MVKFFGVQELVRLLRTVGVEEFLSNLIRYTRDDYLRWPKFEKSPRLASHSADGVIELMPTSDGELYSFKYVNGHPMNTRLRKLTVTAFGVLADVRSGYPLLLSEMTISTALRTAATSALAAQSLARRESGKVNPPDARMISQMLGQSQSILTMTIHSHCQRL